jgi:hypothetical protein
MKRLGLLGAAVAAAVAVAVVSTRGHDSSAAAAVAHAAQKAFDSGSSRVEITISSGSRSFRMDGLIDYRRHRGYLTYKLGETIFDGDVTYTKWPTLQRWLPKAKPWLRSTGEEDDPVDPQARSLRDPAALLGFLRSVSTGVERVGPETVDGVATTRYDGTLDLERIVQAAPADRREELRDELDMIKEDVPTTVPFSIWVDEHGVARRVRYEQDGDGTVMIDFVDFGVPVVLDLPPAEEVMTDDELSTLMDAYFQAHPDGGGDCGSHSEQSDSSGSQGVIVLCSATTDGGMK